MPAINAKGTYVNAMPGLSRIDRCCTGEIKFQSSVPLMSEVKFVPGSGTMRISSRATFGTPA